MRLIPACAGTTRASVRLCRPCRAHPRLRGDHGSPSGRGCVTGGSSPPARGPLGHKFRYVTARRLIPACAGTTILADGTLGSPEAHPRLRGDHLPPRFCAVCSTGSSPPARGPLCATCSRMDEARLIPACAGTTSSLRISRSSIRAHPRLRGDHQRSNGVVVARAGSSPPARGPHLSLRA